MKRTRTRMRQPRKHEDRILGEPEFLCITTQRFSMPFVHKVLVAKAQQTVVG